MLANDLTNKADRCSFSGATNMAVFLTSDGGRTWTRSTHCAAVCGSVALADRRTVIVGHNEGSTLRTTDFGRSWRPGPRLAPPGGRVEAVMQTFWLQGMDFANSKVGYASTKGGGTWRTDDAGLTWTREASSDSAHQLLVSGDVVALDTERAVIAGPAVVSVRRTAPV
ncbi:MAG: hypothetical protein WD794_00025 [Mycobacteriales bacterium]